LSLVVVRKRSSLTSFHQTPLGSPSLLQVSTELEEAQPSSESPRVEIARSGTERRAAGVMAMQGPRARSGMGSGRSSELAEAKAADD